MTSTPQKVEIRLRNAALSLFTEQGYDRTTAAEIARHAGVTERTFFRHFPDKREVLFDREEIVGDFLLTKVAEAREGLGPLAILLHAFMAFDAMLKANREYAVPRERLIADNPALRERETGKIHALSVKIADALKARGIDPLRADLAAPIGMAAFVHASRAWLLDDSVPYLKRLKETYSVLGSLSEAGLPPTSSP